MISASTYLFVDLRFRPQYRRQMSHSKRLSINEQIVQFSGLFPGFSQLTRHQSLNSKTDKNGVIVSRSTTAKLSTNMVATIMNLSSPYIPAKDKTVTCPERVPTKSRIASAKRKKKPGRRRKVKQPSPKIVMASAQGE